MFIVSSKYELTVSFEDLDPMNIVWHGNYVRYMERARCDLFTKLRYTYLDMHNDGIMYPIAKMETKYIKPAEFLDKLIVETSIISIEPTLDMKYKIYKKDTNEKIFEAKTMQIAVNPKTRESVFTPPKTLVQILNGKENEEI